MKLRIANPRNFLATVSFAAICFGLWMERPSLALIVPGALVFSALAVNHLRGGSN